MKSIFLLLTVMAPLVTTGCANSKSSTAANVRLFDREAQLQARKIFDLIYAKCGESYYRSGRDERLSGIEVHARAFDLDKEERFFGYQWKGEARIEFKNGNAEGFDMFRRGGKWFLRAQTRSNGRSTEDILIDDLQSVRPECPSK